MYLKVLNLFNLTLFPANQIGCGNPEVKSERDQSKDVRVDSELGQIDPKWEKCGTF